VEAAFAELPQERHLRDCANGFDGGRGTNPRRLLSPFASKDDLIAEATEAAFNSTIEEMQALTRKSRNRKGVRAIAEDYLSPEHRTDRAHGCPLAALASELSRSDKATRAAATEGIVKMIDTVAAQINDRTPKEAERAAMAIVCRHVRRTDDVENRERSQTCGCATKGRKKPI